MTSKDQILTFIEYLIHPFKTHESFLKEEAGDIPKMGIYDSLSLSWVFVIINGLIRIILLNFILLLFNDLLASSSIDFSEIIDLSGINQFYFLVLSIILDVIFYPLFGFFLIQFWEVIFSFYGKLLKTTGDISDKAHSVLLVSFSSHLLKVIPVFGAMAQSIASLISIYAGLRVQFRASPILSVCIMLTPFVIFIGFLSILLLLFTLMSY